MIKISPAVVLLGAVGLGVAYLAVQSSPGAAQAQPIQRPTTQPQPPGCNNAFIPGTQYVAKAGTGFVVVLGGQVAYTSQSQSDAEQWYNAHVCGGVVQ